MMLHVLSYCDYLLSVGIIFGHFFSFNTTTTTTTACLRFLLSRRCNVNAVLNNGMSVLHIAVSSKCSNKVNLLLQNGAKWNQIYHGEVGYQSQSFFLLNVPFFSENKSLLLHINIPILTFLNLFENLWIFIMSHSLISFLCLFISLLLILLIFINQLSWWRLQL